MSDINETEIYRKADLIERIKAIDEQLKTLNDIGSGLCNKKHCSIGVELLLVDEEEKEKEEYSHESEFGLFTISFGTDWGNDRSKYTDSVSVDMRDTQAIKLVGYLMSELHEERKILMGEL